MKFDSKKLSRRDFIKKSTSASAGILLSNSLLANNINSLNNKKRYAVVGTGHRSELWQTAIYKQYNDTCEIVGLCDINKGRGLYYQDIAKKLTGKTPPFYQASDFDKMITETKPEVIIVTTIDSTHDYYICRAMELGCDVITEKPMTNTAEKCQRIIDAQNKYGKQVTVTFNYRYSPPRTQVKDLLMSGIIGNILSVDFHWMLNTHHGADYFRRWHSQKKFSNGLLLHKSTHHFDLVNWWLSAIPVSVMANGKKEFYTPETAKRFGLNSFHERCHTCPEKDKCAFELDLSKNQRLKELYLDQEKYDGYFRDKCVFRPDIDIEDTMNVIAKYDNGVTLSYSLNAFNAWEGYYVVFNGTQGRLEHKVEEKLYIAGDGNEQGAIVEGGTTIRVYPLRGKPQDFEVWKGEGGHAGGDIVMLEDIFGSAKRNDKYLRAADFRAGAYSLLTGVAANISMQNGKEVLISDLVKNLKRPEFSEMPSKNSRLKMPNKY